MPPIFFTTHPQVKHGTIKILFTPDEEIGRGTAKVDLQKLGARFGYTLDGGAPGSLEDETFSADGVQLVIHGVITHPGDAKGKMVNALKIAAAIVEALPKKELSPETTEKKEGFIHPIRIEGMAERCTIEFIIRDFVTAGLKKKEDLLRGIAGKVLKKYPAARYELIVTEQYRNIATIICLVKNRFDAGSACIGRRIHMAAKTDDRNFFISIGRNRCIHIAPLIHFCIFYSHLLQFINQYPAKLLLFFSGRMAGGLWIALSIYLHIS